MSKSPVQMPLGLPARKLQRSGSGNILGNTTWTGKPLRESDRYLVPVSAHPGWIRAINNTDPTSDVNDADLLIESTSKYFGRKGTPVALPSAAMFYSSLWGAANDGASFSTDWPQSGILLASVGTTIIGPTASGLLLAGLAVQSFTDGGGWANVVLDPNFIGGDVLVTLWVQNALPYAKFTGGGNVVDDAHVQADLVSLAAIVKKFARLRIVLYLDYWAFTKPQLQTINGHLCLVGIDDPATRSTWETAFSGYANQAQPDGIDLIFGGSINTGRDRQVITDLFTGQVVKIIPSSRDFAPLILAVASRVRDFFGLS